jgi:hypothetical protein
LREHDYAAWLGRFLPRLGHEESATLFAPATVSDHTDGPIAHLDGLNLSRASRFRSIAHARRGRCAARADARHCQDSSERKLTARRDGLHGRELTGDVCSPREIPSRVLRAILIWSARCRSCELAVVSRRQGPAAEDLQAAADHAEILLGIKVRKHQADALDAVQDYLAHGGMVW